MKTYQWFSVFIINCLFLLIKYINFCGFFLYSKVLLQDALRSASVQHSTGQVQEESGKEHTVTHMQQKKVK